LEATCRVSHSRVQRTVKTRNSPKLRTAAQTPAPLSVGSRHRECDKGREPVREPPVQVVTVKITKYLYKGQLDPQEGPSSVRHPFLSPCLPPSLSHTHSLTAPSGPHRERP
jgi:hypothetical protein